MTKDILILLALEYSNRNPDRFNAREKVKFIEDLKCWIEGTSAEIDDEVYDFLIDIGLYKKPKREDAFVSYLNQKYGIIRFSKILDVGAGRMCKLSQALAKYGNSMYAIDPKIRLTQNEAKGLGIKSIKLQNFECDEFAKSGRGTPVSYIDYIFGLEPCDATEHIIRQGLKYDKPFDVLLCAAPHKSLDGKEFKNYEDWYEYLSSISAEVEIKKVGTSYYASNEKQKVNEIQMQ